MTVSAETIQRNLEEIRRRIDAAAVRAGRSGEEVRLIAVTKTVGLEEVQTLYDLGIREFGENRLQPARDKIERFPHKVSWHMIGPIQRRKCRDIIELFDAADAVDRVAVAEALARRVEERGGEPSFPVLVEVNVSGEESKHGFTPEALPEALDKCSKLKELDIKGLLTMAPWVDDPEETRPYFAKLRKLAEEHGLPEVSMGMTNDFEIAVEEGATQVRIGSALFKEQP